jgi:spermidine/putrescine transport system substrate-binding protein
MKGKMMARQSRPAAQSWLRDPLTRREALLRGATAGLGLSALGGIAAACGGGSSAASGSSSSAAGPIEGTAVMTNYPGWMGKNVVKSFEAAHPKATIKIVESAPSAESAIVQLLKSGTYDFGLGDATVGGQAEAIGIVQELDWGRIPNIDKVASPFRKNFPWGIPTDQGKIGIGYRPDLVGEQITSWADVWRLAPKFSGKVVFMDLDRDAMGSALKYLGYSTNTHSESELAECQKALIDIKPHLQAFLSTNVGRGLIDGSSVIVMDWDFDVALNQQKESKIEWVIPKEGVTAYLEGWIPVAGTKNLPVVESFMNFALEPVQYTDFVNTTGAAWVEPGVTGMIDPSLANAPSLRPDPATLALVEYEKFLGEALPAWENVWEQVKAA